MSSNLTSPPLFSYRNTKLPIFIFFLSEAETKLVMWTNDIHQWIFRLINYPADFHALLPTMIDTIRMGVAHFGDEFNHIAVSAIYQTCMFNRNFCLDGSRLCNVISNTLKRTSDSQIGFRSFLLQALQKDFERKDFLVKSNCPDDRKVKYLHMIPFHF